MFCPRRVKCRKWQRVRGQLKGVETRGTSLAFGSFGIKALASGQITSQQIEACRKVLTRYVAKGGKMWIRIFPDQPYTQKPPEVTMGAGKGDPVGYVAVVKPGRVLFEVDGLTRESAMDALRKSQAKLPVKTKLVSRS